MTHPSVDNTSTQNNPQNVVEQPVKLTVEEAVVSTPIRTTVLVVSSTLVASLSSQGVTLPPHAGNTLFNPAVARPLFGLTMPMNNRDYHYGMPKSMMVGLHTNMSTFSVNPMKIVLSYNS